VEPRRHGAIGASAHSIENAREPTPPTTSRPAAVHLELPGDPALAKVRVEVLAGPQAVEAAHQAELGADVVCRKRLPARGACEQLGAVEPSAANPDLGGGAEEAGRGGLRRVARRWA
jgi:hypothetical protein